MGNSISPNTICNPTSSAPHKNWAPYKLPLMCGIEI